MQRIRLHDLRHIHATTLLLAGVPVHVGAARLGPADPSVTLRVYAHDFSPTGWVALYDPSIAPPVQRAVAAWDADGVALVVDDRRGQLVTAQDQPGFREPCRQAESSQRFPPLPAGPCRQKTVPGRHRLDSRDVEGNGL